jgi:hypothetical protein
MPQRTIYVKEEHQHLWEEVKKLISEESLSDIVAEGLQRVIDARKIKQGEFARIVLEYGMGNDAGSKVAFHGKEVAFYDNHTAYITPKGNILIHSEYGTDGSEYHVFNDLAEASELDRDGETFYPAELLSEIADQVGENFVQELDI